ncbi:hypothetical protein BC833DRAFT_597761 [Globomyces pollinis-pini]|nr:hypothetical protein BC833DRAFT_597761 [Globomyces pollinis-pini]
MLLKFTLKLVLLGPLLVNSQIIDPDKIPDIPIVLPRPATSEEPVPVVTTRPAAATTRPNVATTGVRPTTTQRDVGTTGSPNQPTSNPNPIATTTRGNGNSADATNTSSSSNSTPSTFLNLGLTDVQLIGLGIAMGVLVLVFIAIQIANCVRKYRESKKDDTLINFAANSGAGNNLQFGAAPVPVATNNGPTKYATYINEVTVSTPEKPKMVVVEPKAGYQPIDNHYNQPQDNNNHGYYQAERPSQAARHQVRPQVPTQVHQYTAEEIAQWEAENNRQYTQEELDEYYRQQAYQPYYSDYPAGQYTKEEIDAWNASQAAAQYSQPSNGDYSAYYNQPTAVAPPHQPPRQEYDVRSQASSHHSRQNSAAQNAPRSGASHGSYHPPAVQPPSRPQ